ncbi:sodium:calcium symporter [Methanobrevibacter sp. YE315]|uniref:sodium-dependent transporter n=1 Tax=Methanobrevibacter sp. YE315 TaxID=1609968 RepID=UPI000764DC69|nr:sodium-dependent transporter [Methanobrevibacter sp. YE315]AMD17714.1 sodium:calcium symporter [Methanobrevibacter sp. YE315]
MSNKNEWNSNLSFLLAMIGSAIGLGNIWRYPYVLYSNGGGTFYIPYFIAILLLGIPFLILEYGVGYNYKSSFAKAITQINSKWQYLGWFIPVTVFIFTVYYSVVLAWDGLYVVLSFSKAWGSNPNAYFATTLLQSSQNFTGLLNFIPLIGIVIAIVWIIIWFISHRGLEKGIGNVSKVLVPLLFIVMMALVGFSLTLPGAAIGLNELFNPNWQLLTKFDIWMAAFAQIIFSISLGMSISFTYASYIKEDTDLITNTLIITFANAIFENIAALGVFSVLGYMSLHSGTAVHDLVTQGIGIVFIVYPTVFNILGQWGFILGPLFFLTVYLAGFTSILSSIEPLSFSIQNKFNISRSKTITFLIIVGALLAMPFATSFGQTLLEYVDTFINLIALLLAIFFECIIFAWMFKAEKLIDFLNSRSKTFKLGKWWLIIVKYILPMFILIIWIGGIIDVVPNWTFSQLILSVLCGIFLLVTTLIFTILPAKDENWNEKQERI